MKDSSKESKACLSYGSLIFAEVESKSIHFSLRVLESQRKFGGAVTAYVYP